MRQIEVEEKTVDGAIRKALEQLQASRDQVAVEILEEGSRGLFGFGAKPARVRVSLGQVSAPPVIQPPVMQERRKVVERQQREDVEKPERPKRQEAEKLERPKRREAPKPERPKRQEAPKPERPPKPRDLEGDEFEDQTEIPLRPETPAIEIDIDQLRDDENLQQIVATAKKALQVILETIEVEYNIDVKKRDDQIVVNIRCENENYLIGKRGTTLDAVQYLVNRIANKHAQEKIQVVLDTSNYRVNRKEHLQRLALRLSRKVKTTGKSVTVPPMNPHDRRIIHLTLQDDPAVKTLSRGNGFMRRVIITTSRNSERQRKE